MHVLPCGTRRDVVKEFRLLASWPGLKQEAITDTMNYSDLDPYAAPRWKASVIFHKGVKGFLCMFFLRLIIVSNA